jgi:hypothetical protein
MMSAAGQQAPERETANDCDFNSPESGLAVHSLKLAQLRRRILTADLQSYYPFGRTMARSGCPTAKLGRENDLALRLSMSSKSSVGFAF